MQYNNTFKNEEEEAKNRVSGTSSTKPVPVISNPAANAAAASTNNTPQAASVLGGNKPVITNPAAHSEDKILDDTGLTNPLEDSQPKEPANVGVRSVLEGEFGVQPGALGYDGEYVILNGKRLLKPAENRDGTTYVQSKDEIVQGLSENARQNGMVAVRDYASSRGLPLNISWNGADGTVSINGRSIKPTYIIDGKAYVSQSELDSLLAVTQKDMGFSRDADILSESTQKYGGAVDEAFQKVMNAGGFSYNPKQDAAFQTFMDMYRRGVEDEYNANMAQARFRTGGVPSSAVMQQAAAIRERALDDAAGYVQQFEDRAYDKWKDGIARDYDTLTTAMSMMQNDYGLKSGSNDKMLDAYYQSQDFGVNMRKALVDLGMSEAEAEQVLKYMPDMYRNEWLNSGYDTENNRINTEINKDFGYPLAQESFQQSQLGTLGSQVDAVTAILNAIRAENQSGVSSGVNWREILKTAGLI